MEKLLKLHLMKISSRYNNKALKRSTKEDLKKYTANLENTIDITADIT